MYMPFPLGGGSSERRLRTGGLTCMPLPNSFDTRSIVKGTPMEASMPRTRRIALDLLRVPFLLRRGSRLQPFTGSLVEQVCKADSLKALSGTKAKTCACQSSERWFNHSLRIQPFLLDPCRQGRFKEKGMYSQASLAGI